jgi:hypothetical protein
MRALVLALAAAMAGMVLEKGVASQPPAAPAAPEKGKSAPDAKPAPAEVTRSKLLKTKVSGSYENARLGDILKDLGDQVDMQAEQPVLWAYGEGFPYQRKVTFSCKDKPLDVVLDQLLTKAGDGLGYLVVSKDGDKYDGWVRLTTTGERGTEKGAPTAEEETSAAEKLTLAKKLIKAGNARAAKPVLEILVKNYPKTKAGLEAKDLLENLDK